MTFGPLVSIKKPSNDDGYYDNPRAVIVGWRRPAETEPLTVSPSRPVMNKS